MVKGERPQTRHLIPAKKGEVRNPHGMPKGTITKHSLLRAIEKAVEGKVTVKDQFTGKRTKKEVVKLLAGQLIADALNMKDNSAAERTMTNKAIQDRLLGKPKETTIHTDPEGNAIKPPTIIINFTDGASDPEKA